MKNHTKLTAPERDLLAIWKADGVSNKECARRLNRHPATIGRELKRNSSLVSLPDGRKKKVYIAISAQAKFDYKKVVVAHSKPLLKNPQVYAYVTSRLRRGWSPDQIAGRLKRLHPNDPHWHICHETIYQFIYDKNNQVEGRPWYEYLRRKQKKRKKRSGRKVHRSHIPERVSIHLRPEEVSNRSQFGHWEGDSVEGKRKSTGAGLHTEVERLSRLIAGLKVKAITSQEAIGAQKAIFTRVPKEARKSTTLDNGRETHLHYQLRDDLNMNTYHADPYSSYQRGTNENGNWHLRYYYPKGTDFATVPDDELQAVIEEINNRPRKILGYQTAREVFDKLVKKEQGVAIGS